jgi:hypothetical protein
VSEVNRIDREKASNDAVPVGHRTLLGLCGFLMPIILELPHFAWVAQ